MILQDSKIVLHELSFNFWKDYCWSLSYIYNLKIIKNKRNNQGFKIDMVARIGKKSISNLPPGTCNVSKTRSSFALLCSRFIQSHPYTWNINKYCTLSFKTWKILQYIIYINHITYKHITDYLSCLIL